MWYVMKIKVYGVNVWSSPRGEVSLATKCVFLHQDLKDMGRPAPFSTQTIEGYGLDSRHKGNFLAESRIKNGEVELIKGDYIMLLLKENIEEYGDSACGHMHYYDGEKLISVYAKAIEARKKAYHQNKLNELREKYPKKGKVTKV